MLVLVPLAGGQPPPPPDACRPPRSTTLLENNRGRLYTLPRSVSETGRLDTYTCEFASGHTFQLDNDLNLAYRPPAMALAGDLFAFVLDFESGTTEVILGGKRIYPRSLELRGSTLHWRSGRTSKRARLG